jgi:hypothetical protein
MSQAQLVRRGVGQRTGSTELAAHPEPRSVRPRARRRPAIEPTLDLPASLLLIALGAWLLVAQGFLAYPLTDRANAHTMDEYGVAIVVVLGGLWLCQHRGSRPAAGICLVAGALLFVAGFTDRNHSDNMHLNEMIVGALIVIAAVVIIALPNPYRALRAEATRVLLTPRPRPVADNREAWKARARQLEENGPSLPPRPVLVAILAALVIALAWFRRFGSRNEGR